MSQPLLTHVFLSNRAVLRSNTFLLSHTFLTIHTFPVTHNLLLSHTSFLNHTFRSHTFLLRHLSSSTPSSLLSSSLTSFFSFLPTLTPFFSLTPSPSPPHIHTPMLTPTFHLFYTQPQHHQSARPGRRPNHARAGHARGALHHSAREGHVREEESGARRQVAGSYATTRNLQP
jgi:hypothetical protein